MIVVELYTLPAVNQSAIQGYHRSNIQPITQLLLIAFLFIGMIVYIMLEVPAVAVCFCGLGVKSLATIPTSRLQDPPREDFIETNLSLRIRTLNNGGPLLCLALTPQRVEACRVKTPPLPIRKECVYNIPMLRPNVV